MNKVKITSTLALVMLGFFALNACFASALVASISNPRMVLYKNMTEKPLIVENSVFINNENNFSVSITLTPTGDFKNLVEFKENNFNLSSGERKEIFYEITISKAGVYNGEIIVTFKGEENELSLAQKLVVAVKGNSGKISVVKGLVIGALVLIIVLLVAVIFLKYKKNKFSRRMK
jgi:hypothetical protein